MIGAHARGQVTYHRGNDRLPPRWDTEPANPDGFASAILRKNLLTRTDNSVNFAQKMKTKIFKTFVVAAVVAIVSSSMAHAAVKKKAIIIVTPVPAPKPVYSNK